MSTKTESLKSIYLDIAGEQPLTERQEHGPSHDPQEEPDISREHELASITRTNGLEDALAGAEST